MDTEYPSYELFGVPRAELKHDLDQLWDGMMTELLLHQKPTASMVSDTGTNGGHLAAPLCLSETNFTDGAAPTAMLPERDAVDAPESGRKGKRGPRKRRVPLCTDQTWHLGNHFGNTSCTLSDTPSASEGQECAGKTNNIHWTADEVALLVDAIEDCGVGRWTALKKKWFRKSVRSAVNLKDKWRNLLKSYTDGNAERDFYLTLDKKLIKRIQKAAVENPYGHIQYDSS